MESGGMMYYNTAKISTSHDPAIILKEYEDALRISTRGYIVHHRRTTQELFINNFNPEWIYCWDSNMDMQICLDYFAVLTYITDYYMKDDTGTTKSIKEALGNADGETLKNKLKTVAYTFVKNRQMGPSEALFRAIPSLTLKESNSECKFLPTGFKESRSRFYRRLTEEEEESVNHSGVKIQGMPGEYESKPSLLEKYCRREVSHTPSLKELSYSQFSQRYRPIRVSKNIKTLPDSHATEEDIQEKNYVMTSHAPSVDHSFVLPEYIKIKDVQVNEPGYMKLVRNPYVLRFMKFNRIKNPHEYKLSQLQLYHPFLKEEELGPENMEQCEMLYNQRAEDGILKIQKLKSQVLEHMEDVEAAREHVENMQNEIQDLEAGVALDSENAQGEADCDIEGCHECSQNLQTEIEEEEHSSCKKCEIFRKIQLSSDTQLKQMIADCDEDQRIVLDIAETYSRSWKKSLAGKIRPDTAPLLMVHGGAGSGKSRLIRVITEVMERNFRSPGDDINCPYILITAFTGTAAANIDGHTLHSAFSFNFGRQFMSLSDKKRDQKRTALKNLKVLVIDEISLVDSDMLYKIDLRLQEITQVTTVPFGGIALFTFGDMMQLKPVRSNYIFDMPKNEQFQIAFHVNSLWSMFKPVTLTKNHRQAGDKMYADLLNRLRIGEITEEDMILLRSRIRKKNDPDLPKEALYVARTNTVVNDHNTAELQKLDHEMVTSIAKIESYGKSTPQYTVDNSTGKVSNTPLQYELHMKKKAKVMLTFNVDTLDSLTNGSFGEIVNFEYYSDGTLKNVLVKFFDSKSGKNKRKSLKDEKYERNQVTPIGKIEFPYHLSKGSDISTCGTVQQFPLKLSFAATAHKVQGQTIGKPNKLIVDLTSVCEPAMGYVMLSRVQELSQLYIVDAVDEQNFKCEPKAKEEIRRLSENEMCSYINVTRDKVVLSTLNIRSLRKNFEVLKKEIKNLSTEVICLQETWLEEDLPNTDEFKLEGMTLCLNNVGRGRGIATFINGSFKKEINVNDQTYQISVVTSEARSVLNIYRSGEADVNKLTQDIQRIICQESFQNKEIIITGDINICYISDTDSELFKVLHSLQFKQLVMKPTHVMGGLIDQVYVRNPLNIYEVIHQTIPFMDHDMLHVVKM